MGTGQVIYDDNLAVDETFKKAPQAKAKGGDQAALGL